MPPEELTRSENDPLEEAMVQTSLIELNPEIAENTSRADEIIAKLRRLFATTTADNLVEQNEKFKEMVFDKNAFPFGENHEHIPIKYFGTKINVIRDKIEIGNPRSSRKARRHESDDYAGAVGMK